MVHKEYDDQSSEEMPIEDLTELLDEFFGE